ncbi:MAG: YraN family protein, partial [Lachnospiraceae bacterium]|nr:YraN family protein [Lachnospiraceae bacterium]
MYQNKKVAARIVTGNNKRKTGAIFEAKAVQFLESQGYQIVETNYRCRFGEIDIVAWDGKEA